MTNNTMRDGEKEKAKVKSVTVKAWGNIKGKIVTRTNTKKGKN